MNLEVTESVVRRYVDGAFGFRIFCDGHGSFTVELREKKHADTIYDFLHTLGYKAQRLDRPGFYSIH